MPIHQLDLQKKGRSSTDDEKAVAHMRGRISLREALGVEASTLAAYRRQAEALFKSEQWQKSIDVIQGLMMLDAVGLTEASMLARAYEALGQTEKAGQVGLVLDGILFNQQSRIDAAEVSQ